MKYYFYRLLMKDADWFQPPNAELTRRSTAIEN